MELSTAIRLIDKGVLKSNQPQRWADFGAGDGLFTRALASVLSSGSTVMAIDQNAASLSSIQWSFETVALKTKVGDFTSMNWKESLDGVLMANALHYVRDQFAFLTKVKAILSTSGRVLVVEYERRQPNPWVPYPIAFEKLKDIGARAGFSAIEKLEEAPSVYDNASIYSATLLT